VRPGGGAQVSLRLNNVAGAVVDSTRPIGEARGTLLVTGSVSKLIHVSDDSLLDVSVGEGANPAQVMPRP
jgi:hypothetical protein